MTNILRDQISEIINEQVGLSSSKIIIATITKIDGDKKTCTVCPVDMDAIWEIKKYYARTKIDRTAVQGLIERVSLFTSDSIKINDINIGDKVAVGYNEDRPYILQKAKNKIETERKFAINDQSISTYDWLGGESFGEFNEFNDMNPIPSELMGS